MVIEKNKKKKKAWKKSLRNSALNKRKEGLVYTEGLAIVLL